MCLWTFYGGFVGIMSRFKRGVSVIKSLLQNILRYRLN